MLAAGTFALASLPMPADAITLGSVLSVSGPAALLNDPELKTLPPCVEKSNRDGGVPGRTIQLVHDDGGTDKAKVCDEIEATKGFIGTGGRVNISATDHMSLDL